MKTFVLSIFVLCASLIGYSQTTNPLPCVQYYSNSNLGGGDCKTAKQGNLKYYPGYGTTPANMNYFPTGKFVIYFKSPVPAGTKAPEILSAGVDDGDGNILPPPYDYKYAPHNDDFSVARSSPSSRLPKRAAKVPGLRTRHSDLLGIPCPFRKRLGS